MANPDVGYIDCPQCGKESPVRWQKGVVGTKLYYFCDRCGQFFPRKDFGQKLINANMRPITPENPDATTEPKPEPKANSTWGSCWKSVEVPEKTPENPKPEPVTKPEPEKQPEPEQKEQSAWAKFWEGDE